MSCTGALLQGACGQGTGLLSPGHECPHPGGGVQHPCPQAVGRGGHEGAGRPDLLPAESVSAPWPRSQEQCRNQGGAGKAWPTAGYGHLRGV